ncbi:hypothetical protein B0T10DRAFT_467943 [Thelonectria olida]|uniref:Uncharacterized protein n=1 Tax=Thelonectria olida TaxID=1576542 RepID=A0A9P9AHM5_9HYPO|nr:hypothetical protein B0T10DRAFT_467943 [Thelonectria olida]
MPLCDAAMQCLDDANTVQMPLCDAAMRCHSVMLLCNAWTMFNAVQMPLCDAALQCLDDGQYRSDASLPPVSTLDAASNSSRTESADLLVVSGVSSPGSHRAHAYRVAINMDRPSLYSAQDEHRG